MKKVLFTRKCRICIGRNEKGERLYKPYEEDYEASFEGDKLVKLYNKSKNCEIPPTTKTFRKAAKGHSQFVVKEN